MTHPPRFMNQILARPDDDSPRLRYADWLESSGDPLGEFIRLQCEMARHPRRVHERRTQELLAQFRGDWSQALADRVGWCSFRRGFIEEIALTDRQLIKHAREVFGCAPVLDVHLHSDGKRLQALPALPHVQYTFFLDLSSQHLDDDDIEGLADAPLLAHVHGLNLGSNHLGDDGLESLFESPHLGNLRELYLNDNPITDDGMRRFVMSPIVERLDRLDVRFTRISQESVDVLRHILSERVLA